jgi:hypothetical protein
MVHGLSVEVDRTFVREHKAGDDSEQGRLATTTWTEEGKELSALNVEIDVANNPLFAIGFPDAVKFHFRRLHR